MKTFCFCLSLLLLAGCGERDVRQSKSRGVYPALDESPPPPLLPDSGSSGQPEAVPEPKAPSAEVVEDGWVPRQFRKEEQLKRLREYAAKAPPDDPFALTEKEIEALSKLDNLEIH